MKVADLKLTVAIPKPRDPNQAVLASKKNAGGAMRDKKQELKRGREKHKARTFEEEGPEDELLEGRPNVYGAGDEVLTSHSNKTLQAVGKGDVVKVMTPSGVAKITKVQLAPGNTMYKLDREVKQADGSTGPWVSAKEVSLDLSKGAAPDAKHFRHKNAAGN